MSTKEHGTVGLERKENKNIYLRAVWFWENAKQNSLAVYKQLHGAVSSPEHNINTSIYRFQFGFWHVVILGEAPSEELQEKIEVILSQGNEASLPWQVIDILRMRYKRASRRLLKEDLISEENHYPEGTNL